MELAILPAIASMIQAQNSGQNVIEALSAAVPSLLSVSPPPGLCLATLMLSKSAMVLLEWCYWEISKCEASGFVYLAWFDSGRFSTCEPFQRAFFRNLAWHYCHQLYLSGSFIAPAKYKKIVYVFPNHSMFHRITVKLMKKQTFSCSVPSLTLTHPLSISLEPSFS